MQSDDTQYEFEAPRYVDFTAPDAVEDGDADHWFDAHDATPTAGTPFKQTELPEFSVDEVTEGPTEDSLTHAESLMEVSEVALTSSINEAQTEVAPITTAAPITRAKKASQMTRPLTVPKEFHFSKSHQEKLLSKVKKSPGAIVKKKVTRGPGDLTVPEPFQFQTSLRSFGHQVAHPSADPKSPFVPLAMRVKSFETKTPDRLKKQPGKSIAKDLTKLTFPKSPFLRTRHRVKMASAMSTEERDAAELSQIRPFKAKPVNEKVLKGTVPVSKPSRFDLTVPMSPAITKPKALAPRLPSPERIIKANPVPDLKPFEPKVKHRVIEVQEFELPGDAVRQKKLQELEEKRRLENEEITAKRQFKAQPLPETIDHPSSLPSVEFRQLTEPKPFKLQTEERGHLHQMTLNEQLEREQQQEEQKKHFVANPLPEFEPFVVKKSNKPIVVPDDIALNTDLRAQERQEFEDMLRRKEMEEEATKENMRKLQMEKERELVRKIRNDSVHKAQPMKTYVNTFIHQSEKRLTVPQSPMIGDKRKKLMGKKG